VKRKKRWRLVPGKMWLESDGWNPATGQDAYQLVFLANRTANPTPLANKWRQLAP
jgi:hypothetical protein